MGAVAISVAAVAVSGKKLTRFATLSGYPVTMENAPQVIAHFSALRRRRLACVIAAVPVAGFTGDPFYLVAGWCAAPVLMACALRKAPRSPLQEVPPPAGAYPVSVSRSVWLIAVAAAVAAALHLLLPEGLPDRLIPGLVSHAAVAVAAGAAVTLAGRGLRARTQDPAARALRAWSARNVHLAGSAVVLASVLLIPGETPWDEPPASSAAPGTAPGPASFRTIRRHEPPACPFLDGAVGSCPYWQVNGQPFPQAAAYVVTAGGAPERAPFAVAPDRRAVVYLHAETRRLTYQDARVTRPLTAPLPDAEVPAVAFHGRRVALTGSGVRIIDTRTWASLAIPGARAVHDVNDAGVVVSEGRWIRVLDADGRRRMRLPYGGGKDSYHLRRDGRRLAVVRWATAQAETYDAATGARLSAVTFRFPGDDTLEKVLGWTKDGRFLVRSSYRERSYFLDLATGRLHRR